MNDDQMNPWAETSYLIERAKAFRRAAENPTLPWTVRVDALRSAGAILSELGFDPKKAL